MSIETLDPYEKKLLSALVDKYEASAFFRHGTRPNRRIKLRLFDEGKSDFPGYHIERTEIRTHTNQAVLALEDRHLVFYCWMTGEETHIVAQVWLNIHNLDAAYASLGRKPKRFPVDELSRELLEMLEQIKTGWICRFLEDNYLAIVKNGPVPAGCHLPEQPAIRKNLFQTLLLIDRLGKAELLERTFSMQCFGDSKVFENTVRRRLLDIIRRYTDCGGDSSDEELLRFAGIVKYPEQFEFRGPLVIRLEGRSVDYTPLRYSTAISSTEINRGILEFPRGFRRILSIENKANYIEYSYQNVDESELVVYHGGQYSPVRGTFFRALAAAAPAACPWYHWSDIDYGGFSMLARLRREVRSDIRPYRMSQAELEKYARLTVRISPKYAETLRELLGLVELTDCHPCIKYMIEKRVKLEQEAMLI
jgi:hypothetical protein